MKIIVLILFLLFPSPAFACSQDSFGPCLFAPDGTYLGNDNNIPSDGNSINNPYGRFGTPYGYGVHSPTSPYGSVTSPMSPNFGLNPYSADPSQRPDWGTAPGSKYSEPLNSGQGWMGPLVFSVLQARARREAIKREQEREAAAENSAVQQDDSIAQAFKRLKLMHKDLAGSPLVPGQVPAIDPDNKTVPANLPTLDAKDFGPPLPNTGR